MAILPSPLSGSVQGINESTVSGSIFGGNRQDPETKSSLQSLSSSVTSLQNQVNELSSLSTRLIRSLLFVLCFFEIARSLGPLFLEGLEFLAPKSFDFELVPETTTSSRLVLLALLIASLLRLIFLVTLWPSIF